MANVYCDQSGGNDGNGGTDFETDAWLTLAFALNGSNTGNGDILWVKNNASIGSTVAIEGPTAFNIDPPKIIGCIAAATGSTATPPTAAHIVPGLRNGSSTRAYDQTAGSAPPQLTVTGSTNDFSIEGRFAFIYGMRFIAGDRITIGINELQLPFEECYFECGAEASNGDMFLGGSSGNNETELIFLNCSLKGSGASSNISSSARVGKATFQSTIFNFLAAMFVGGAPSTFNDCDFSAQSTTIVQAGGGKTNAPYLFNNCKLNGSSAFVTGSITERFRTEFIQTSSASGKTTGQSFQEIEIVTDNGTITHEVTAFRTDGADDGASGGWSLAFTPTINDTQDNYIGLVGPKMTIEVVGDGTSQTLTVFIANSGSGDYDDDEVWLVVRSPSATGTANYDYATTQMDLLATPVPVTNDTGSAWGGSVGNHQKFSVPIAPDYDGFVECWVVFAKNFGADPETLYVDPLPVIT